MYSTLAITEPHKYGTGGDGRLRGVWEDTIGYLEKPMALSGLA
jgi:hypothetical protein